MNNISNLNISNIAKQVIERYVGKKDYVVRIRVNKKHNVELIVYYEGRKSFEVKNNKLLLDYAYFFTKGNKEFALPSESEIEGLTALGFTFKIGIEIKSDNPYYKDGYRYRIIVKPSSAKKGTNGYYDNYKEEIGVKMNTILAALKKINNDFIHIFGDKMYDDEPNVNSFYTKNVDNTINYFELNELLKVGIKNTVNQKGIKKIDFNEKIVGSKKSYTEEEYSIIDAIMENRIKSYNFGLLLEDNEEEYNEKIYQQLLMNKMFDKNDREQLFKVDNCPFKDCYAYEMEYNLYAANRTNRNQKNQKGRVDNIFINGNKILFTELKYDENVIGGTNGIHKHLIDLINGFENNDEALSEIYDYVCDYNEVLTCINDKEEYLIKNVKRFNESEIEKEFIIICGYSKNKRDIVYNELNRIYKLNGKKCGMKKNYELILDGQKVNLEEMKVLELISLLKDRYHCETKIYLVDDNYTKFEIYKK